jgi:2-amino-4-hydroxy-6-hydroxymethyldihydropteridine diphosphokinase
MNGVMSPSRSIPGRTIVLSLGGNLGNRFETLQYAVDALVDTPSLWIDAVSPVYETEPFGGPAGGEGSRDLSEQPAFLNAVLLGTTDLSPATLLERALAVEQALGRERTEHWEARAVDVDLIAYGELVQDGPGPILPHPRAHQRAFVLVPWQDVDPGARLPGHGAIADLLADLAVSGIERRDDLVLQL